MFCEITLFYVYIEGSHCYSDSFSQKKSDVAMLLLSRGAYLDLDAKIPIEYVRKPFNSAIFCLIERYISCDFVNELLWKLIVFL